MEENAIYELLLVILLIFGILQIILFFKVWGMTNDVEAINKIAKEVNNPSWDTAKIETLAGNYDKAFEIYHRCFIAEVYKLYNRSGSSSNFYAFEYKTLVKTYTKQLDTLHNGYSIEFEKYDTLEKVRDMIFRA